MIGNDSKLSLKHQVLAFAAILGVLTIGPAIMDHGMAHSAGCIAAVLEGGICPDVMDGLNLVNLHAEAFQTFYSFVSITEAAVLFVFASLLVWIWHLSKADLGVAKLKRVWFRLRKSVAFVSPPIKINLLRWFSFHENSPAFIE
ncbi:MAG: hypothetical protein AAB561_00625 [Patescibacteria group bacterium]